MILRRREIGSERKGKVISVRLSALVIHAVIEVFGGTITNKIVPVDEEIAWSKEIVVMLSSVVERVVMS